MNSYTFEDVLDGEPNVDHRGEVRWWFTNKDDKSFWFTEDELSNYFEIYQNEMEDCWGMMQLIIKSNEISRR
ncbi:MAG: hypothetical protein R3250_17235 [Melioribacteraceae bacterium]|nr:hypothetical protein [Melioribacteraceae bacterium]